MKKKFLRFNLEFIWFIGTSDFVIKMSNDSVLIDTTMSCCHDCMLGDSSSSTLTFQESKITFHTSSRKFTGSNLFFNFILNELELELN